jgi:hypothetical protein
MCPDVQVHNNFPVKKKSFWLMPNQQIALPSLHQNLDLQQEATKQSKNQTNKWEKKNKL